MALAAIYAPENEFGIQSLTFYASDISNTSTTAWSQRPSGHMTQ